MGDYSKCKWCGKTFEKSGLSKFKGAYTLGIAGKEAYCSTRCETEATGGSNSTGAATGGAGFGSGQPQVIIQKEEPTFRPPTKEEIEYDLEKKRKADARREEKIKKYEKEGKKFLLFITEKPILAFVLFFVVFPAVVFFITAIISKNGPAGLLVATLPMLLFLGLYLKDSMKK
jgi:hypothetical protein